MTCPIVPASSRTRVQPNSVRGIQSSDSPTRCAAIHSEIHSDKNPMVYLATRSFAGIQEFASISMIYCVSNGRRRLSSQAASRDGVTIQFLFARNFFRVGPSSIEDFLLLFSESLQIASV